MQRFEEIPPHFEIFYITSPDPNKNTLFRALLAGMLLTRKFSRRLFLAQLTPFIQRTLNSRSLYFSFSEIDKE